MNNLRNEVGRLRVMLNEADDEIDRWKREYAVAMKGQEKMRLRTIDDMAKRYEPKVKRLEAEIRQLQVLVNQQDVR